MQPLSETAEALLRYVCDNPEDHQAKTVEVRRAMTARRPNEKPQAPPQNAIGRGCDLCGDQGPLLLRARCHLTAPLSAELDGDVLILRCYLPECGREVARFVVDRKRP